MQELAQRGWSIVGVEPDPKAISQANGLTIYSGTAEEIPHSIQDDRFDLVIMSHTLEHCLDPVAAVRNAAALLKPEGRLLIEVPNKNCVHFRTFGPASECFDVPRHLFFFGPCSLRRLVERCGLRVEEEYRHGLTRHHLPSWRATERRIRGYIRAQKGDATDHSLAMSMILLAREALAPRTDRYDAIGLWAVRA
jgi:SAM-dependent methyltransferase